MKKNNQKKAETRAKILKKVGILAKKQGFATSGVDAMMAASDLTAGAFYGHFSSKAELLNELIKQEISRSTWLFYSEHPNDHHQNIQENLGKYLSQEHVAKPEYGCILPALTAEIARTDLETRGNFETGVLEIWRKLHEHCADEAHTWAFLAQVVGAVMLARAMATPETQAAILEGVLRVSLDFLVKNKIKN